MRVAAASDLHVRAKDGEAARVSSLFADVALEADVLVLCGDLTDHGRASEAEVLLQGLRDVGLPILAVLGNHDHESGAAGDLRRLLESGGVQVIERRGVVIEGVGFAGAKGFCGGFGRRIVRAFGEETLKAFVTESVVEAEGLRAALLSLTTPTKVAVLHYAPVMATLEGEPQEIHAFLGTSRLERAIDEGGAALAVHGHAHHGSPRGDTTGGVPVHNVALPLRLARGEGAYEVLEVPSRKVDMSHAQAALHERV